jgi:Family of unknown function (DUF6497)
MTIFHFDPAGIASRLMRLSGLAMTAGLVGGILSVQAQDGGVTIIPAEDTSPVDVPSGQPLTLIEVIWNVPGPAGTAVRFHFLAPEITPGGSIGFDVASTDMAALCDTYAVPRVVEAGATPDQIIIAMSDRVVPFGQTDADATQFFEAYSLQGDTCIWEMF